MRNVRLFTFLLALLAFTSCSLAYGSPTISASPTSISANSTLSYGCGNIPANQNIAITNSGSGTLSSPTISATYNQGNGWLNWQLSGSGNSYTLAVSFQNLCISAGTYTGTIKITSSGASNSPVSVPVTLYLSASGTPTISLSPTSLSFSATAGGSNPSAQSVTVSNTGGGTLASPTTSISYSSGSGWLTVNCTGSSSPYTCSTQPNISGLSSGTYDATVSVASSGASNTPQTYSVSLTVAPSGAPTLATSPSSVSANSTLAYGCGNIPSTQNVSITNSGGGTLATPTIGSVTYNQGSGWLNPSISGSGNSTTLAVAFQNLCIAAGTYTGTISIISSNASNSPVSVPVTLVISSGSGSPTISLSPGSLTFSATQGGANPAAQNVSVSNSGGGTLASPTTSISYGSGNGWLAVSCTGSSAPYSCSNQVTTGSLAAGTYNATVNVSSSGATNSPQTYTVSFTVNSGSSPTISLSPNTLSFSASAGGSNPSAQNVSVSNGGSGTLASPTTSINYGSGSGWLSVNCTGSSAPYTCSTQPTTGSLAAGTYTATVQVASSGASNSPQSYTVSFTVTSGSVCTMTVLNNTADCGPYDYTPDTETTVAQTVVGQGAWNASAAPGMSETTTVTNPGDWNSVINISGNPGDAVITYPSIGQYYNGETLSSFSAMYSGYTFSVDTSSNDSVDVGHDIWLNNWANEIMIQPYIVNRGGQCGPVLATVQFGGSHGVPTNTWVLCQYGSEIIWQIKQPSGNPSTFGFTSGSVDVLSMLNWLVTNGYLPSSNTITEIGFGFEVCYTNGQNLTYSISSYSLTDN